MNLIPWRRRHPVPVTRMPGCPASGAAFRDELDRLLDRFMPGSWWSGSFGPIDLTAANGFAMGAFVPRIDVTENDRHVTVRAEIPGVDPGDIEVSVSGRMLRIHGEKQESTEDRADDHYHCERNFGSFTRTVELPPTVDVEDVQAQEKNGVLTIRVAKHPAAAGRRISIKGAGRPMADAESG